MQIKNYSLLVFDWDGTIVDSEGLAVESMQQTAKELGYPIPPSKLIHENFGLSIEKVAENLFPDQKYQPIFSQIFFKYFNEETLATYFFEHAIETLIQLKNQGFTLAVATNRPRAKLNSALTTANIEHIFTTTRCPEEGAPKPDPNMLLTILEELNHDPHNTLMIGDSVFDMQFAKNANVDALAVCYGHSKKEQLANFKPVGFVEKIKDLKTILKKSLTK